MTIPSWVCKLGAMENIFGLMTTGLGKTTSRFFGSSSLEIPEVGLSRMKGLKPWIVGTIKVPFWTDAGNVSTVASNAKTKGGKPFFRADAPESTSDSMISLMMIKVEEVGGILPRYSHMYLSQSLLNPTDTALWLVPTWVARGHTLDTMQLSFCTNSLLIQMIPQLTRL